MNDREIRQELLAYCQAKIQYYMDFLNDKKINPVRPTEQEQLIDDFTHFIQGL